MMTISSIFIFSFENVYYNLRHFQRIQWLKSWKSTGFCMFSTILKSPSFWSIPNQISNHLVKARSIHLSMKAEEEYMVVLVQSLWPPLSCNSKFYCR